MIDESGAATAGRPRTSDLSILIVDDSPVFRNVLRKAIAQEEGCRLCAQAATGQAALDMIVRLRPDVVTLDRLLPDMDGVEVLQKFCELRRECAALHNTKIVMLSGYTGRESTEGIRALELGAEEIITKPSGVDVQTGIHILRQSLRNVCSLVRCMRVHNTSAEFTEERIDSDAASVVEDMSQTPLREQNLSAILIGSSTGGPKALMKILPEICEATSLPVLVAQHMPADFTQSLARNLQTCCAHNCSEGNDGQPVRSNCLYIAPGGKDMEVRQGASGAVISVSECVEGSSISPSVDRLFYSASKLWGGSTLGIILTGMGDDGTRGALALKECGSQIIVQDEASSTVWGMPGSAWKAGAACRMVGLDEIPLLVGRIERCSAGEV